MRNLSGTRIETLAKHPEIYSSAKRCVLPTNAARFAKFREMTDAKAFLAKSDWYPGIQL